MTGRYERALLLAVRSHHGQERWNKEPYVCHPIRVAMSVEARLLQAGVEAPSVIEDYKIAAVLHDVVEDTSITLDEIREQFGHAVADAVDHLTNHLPDGGAYEAFIERCTKNAMAVRVKIADLEDNSIGLKAGSARQIKYNAALAKLRPLVEVS